MRTRLESRNRSTWCWIYETRRTGLGEWRPWGPLTFPSPDLAEHTVEIANEILKMDSATIENLIERGILEI